MANNITPSSTYEAATDEVSKPKGPIKIIGLSGLFIFLVLLFTVTKLPQTKLTNLIQGYLQQGLDPYGIYITDRGRDLSVWRGFRYLLTQPTLELADQTRVELDELEFSPRFLSLFKGQLGGSLILRQGPAHIEAIGSGRGDHVDASVELDQVDLGKFGLLSFAGGLKGTGLISGSTHVEGSLSDLPTLIGLIQLKLKKLRIDEQTLLGFQLPTLNVAEGNIEMSIEHGKLLMKNVHIGKASDDVQIVVTGEITLNRNVNASQMNLRAVLGFSEKVKATITLLDSIMAPARQLDGTYAYKLTGALSSPMPMPDPNNNPKK